MLGGLVICFGGDSASGQSATISVVLSQNPGTLTLQLGKRPLFSQPSDAGFERHCWVLLVEPGKLGLLGLLLREGGSCSLVHSCLPCCKFLRYPASSGPDEFWSSVIHTGTPQALCPSYFSTSASPSSSSLLRCLCALEHSTCLYHQQGTLGGGA